MYIGEEPSAKIPTGNDSGESQSNTSASASPLVISRKHTRSPSPVAKSPSVTPTSTTDTTTTTTQPAPATPPADNTKPVQTNKGRCFKCRVKVDRSLFISIYSPDVLSYNAPSGATGKADHQQMPVRVCLLRFSSLSRQTRLRCRFC